LAAADDRVHVAIEEMLEELERRLSEPEAAPPNCNLADQPRKDHQRIN